MFTFTFLANFLWWFLCGSSDGRERRRGKKAMYCTGWFPRDWTHRNAALHPIAKRTPAMPHRWLSTVEGAGIPIKKWEILKFHIAHQIFSRPTPIDSLCFSDENNIKNDVIWSIMKEIM